MNSNVQKSVLGLQFSRCRLFKTRVWFGPLTLAGGPACCNLLFNKAYTLGPKKQSLHTTVINFFYQVLSQIFYLTTILEVVLYILLYTLNHDWTCNCLIEVLPYINRIYYIEVRTNSFTITIFL